MDRINEIEGPYAWVDDEGDLDQVGFDGWLYDRARLPLAALCLEGQPFGFTPDDVKLIAWAADSACACRNCRESVDGLRSLAARIAALLPPNEHQLPSSDDASAGGGNGGSV